MTYLPEHFAQDDRERIIEFLHGHPFATVVLQLDGSLHPTPIPLIYQPAGEGWGKFIGHVARINRMWRADPEQEVLVIINGRDTYITPNWYPGKQVHHKVVPTWNYATVHAWGRITANNDAKFKRMVTAVLTNIHEKTNQPRWKVGDAPQDYISMQLGKIVGIEIQIDRLVAKWKLSQNRTEEDREGVMRGLEERDDGQDANVLAMMKSEDT